MGPTICTRVGLGVVAIGSIAIALYAAVAYSVLPPGTLLSPEMAQKFSMNPVGIYTHVFGSAVALLLGPLQFISRLRDSRPRVHRWTGRIYLGAGVLAGGFSALYLSVYAYAGPIAKWGFACLAVAWVFTGGRAYVAIRAGRIEEHRRWMIRNFALTFAAVTLRLYLPLSGVVGVEFETAYRAVAWLCWIPNLAVAEWIVWRRRGVDLADDSPGSLPGKAEHSDAERGSPARRGVGAAP